MKITVGQVVGGVLFAGGAGIILWAGAKALIGALLLVVGALIFDGSAP